MDLSVRVNELLEKQGYEQWSHLLNFFNEYYDILCVGDKKRIVRKLEEHRSEHNEREGNEEDYITIEDTVINANDYRKYIEAKTESEVKKDTAVVVYA